MKNQSTNITYLRNEHGEFIGGKRKQSRIIVGALLLGLAVTTVYASSTSAKAAGNKSAVSGDLAGTAHMAEGCTKQGTGTLTCDFTEGSTNNRIVAIAKSEGIHWYTAESIAKIQQDQEKLSKYQKKYPYAKKEVINNVLAVASKLSYTDTDFLMALIDCESKFNPYNTNAKGNKPVGSVDLGLLQYNDHWKVKSGRITRECAFNVECSTEKAIEDLKAGRANQWMCTKIVKQKLVMK